MLSLYIFSHQLLQERSKNETVIGPIATETMRSPFLKHRTKHPSVTSTWPSLPASPSAPMSTREYQPHETPAVTSRPTLPVSSTAMSAYKHQPLYETPAVTSRPASRTPASSPAMSTHIEHQPNIINIPRPMVPPVIMKTTVKNLTPVEMVELSDGAITRPAPITVPIISSVPTENLQHSSLVKTSRPMTGQHLKSPLPRSPLPNEQSSTLPSSVGYPAQHSAVTQSSTLHFGCNFALGHDQDWPDAGSPIQSTLSSSVLPGSSSGTSSLSASPLGATINAIANLEHDSSGFEYTDLTPVHQQA